MLAARRFPGQRRNRRTGTAARKTKTPAAATLRSKAKRSRNGTWLAMTSQVVKTRLRQIPVFTRANCGVVKKPEPAGTRQVCAKLHAKLGSKTPVANSESTKAVRRCQLQQDGWARFRCPRDPRPSRCTSNDARAQPTCHERRARSEEHTSELQSHSELVCRLLLEKKKKKRRRSQRDKEDQNREERPGNHPHAGKEV